MHWTCSEPIASYLALARAPRLREDLHPTPAVAPGDEGGVPLSVLGRAIDTRSLQSDPPPHATAPPLHLGSRVWVSWYGLHPAGMQKRWWWVPWPPPASSDAPAPVRLEKAFPFVKEVDASYGHVARRL